MKANRTNEIEGIEITLTREKTPIAFKNKLDELMEQKAFDTEDEAIEWIESNPIYVEMIYEKHHGLFLVESEAIESGGVCSPYTKDDIETDNDDDGGFISADTPEEIEKYRNDKNYEELASMSVYDDGKRVGECVCFAPAGSKEQEHETNGDSTDEVKEFFEDIMSTDKNKFLNLFK